MSGLRTCDCLQDALAELVERTKSMPHPPPARISGLLPSKAQLEAPFSHAKGRNAIHPAPMIDWHSSDHSSDEDDQGPSQQLMAAAISLLQDPTLARADTPRRQATPNPPRDWDAFVQQQIAVKVRAATSSKLLAMRNAVPNLSSRMVFASQVSKAIYLRNSHVA